MDAFFDFQGHRGARGLKPENTFPSFEVAFDLGVTAIETDVHLTRDGVPVLVHDAAVTERIFELIDGKSEPLPDAKLLASSLCMEQLRSYRANRNPDPGRFPRQNRNVTPLAALYSSQKNVDPYALRPSLTCSHLQRATLVTSADKREKLRSNRRERGAFVLTWS